MALWRGELGGIQPFYAVKSNPDTKLVGWLREEGVKFDCASVREFDTVFRAGGQSTDIVYANPSKSTEELNGAIRRGVDVSVVDSVEEVEKMGEAGWCGNVLVRLAVDDKESRSPFSLKFGAEEGVWGDILKAIRRTAGLQFGGVSFHIGSASQNPAQFTRAIERARKFQGVARERFRIMDIGGGFLPDMANFSAAAQAIRRARAVWEEAGDCPGTWIAEPGRFFSAHSTGLLVPIIAKKRGPGGVGWRYVLAESLYGQFSCIPFDHATPHWELVGDVQRTGDGPAYFFGRTCDSLDLIAHAVDSPVYEVGDVLWFPGMGAYTNASASEFNGFAVPEAVYLEESLPTEVGRVTAGVSFPISTVSELKLCV